MFKVGDKVKFSEAFRKEYDIPSKEGTIENMYNCTDGVIYFIIDKHKGFWNCTSKEIEPVTQQLYKVDDVEEGNKEPVNNIQLHKTAPSWNKQQEDKEFFKKTEKSIFRQNLEILDEAERTGKKFRRNTWKDDWYFYFKEGILFSALNEIVSDKGLFIPIDDNSLFEWYTEPKKKVRYDAVSSDDGSIVFKTSNSVYFTGKINLSEIKQDEKGLYIEREE